MEFNFTEVICYNIMEIMTNDYGRVACFYYIKMTRPAPYRTEARIYRNIRIIQSSVATPFSLVSFFSSIYYFRESRLFLKQSIDYTERRNKLNTEVEQLNQKKLTDKKVMDMMEELITYGR